MCVWCVFEVCLVFMCWLLCACDVWGVLAGVWCLMFDVCCLLSVRLMFAVLFVA